MKGLNRVDDNLFIISLEEKYPVENWLINDVHIWPIIRNRLHLDTLNDADYQEELNQEEKSKKVKLNFFQKIVADNHRVRKLQQKYLLVKSLFLYYLLRFIPNCERVYVSSTTYYSVLNKLSIHKFFQPLFDQDDKLNKKYLLLEHLTTKEYPNSTKRKIKFENYGLALNYLVRDLKIYSFSNEKYDDFINDLKNYGFDTSNYVFNNIQNIYREIEKYALLFDRIAKYSKASEFIGICYYYDFMYGMVLTSYRRNLNSVDIQHGVQGHLALVYSSLTKIPERGHYNVIPKEFWNWDKRASSLIEDWIIKLKSSHNTIITGNLWVEYCKKVYVNFELKKSNEKSILIALQPYGDVIQKIIKEVIENTNGIHWTIRTHPLQEKESVMKIILNNIATEKHNNLKFTSQFDTNIVEDLLMSDLLITRSSTVILEAIDCGVSTVLTDEMGYTYYQDLIDGENVYYCEEYLTLQNIVNQLVIN
jgi:hypothetical protein